MTHGAGPLFTPELEIEKSPQYCQWSFESTGLSVQEERLEIDFQDGDYGSHLGFLIKMILVFFCFVFFVYKLL